MSDEHVARVAALFDSVAAEYDQHVPFFSAFADRLVAWTGVRTGETVLDIGAGRGAVCHAVGAAGASAVAVDISSAMLRELDVPRVQADARALPVRSGAFDVAVGAFSIHLLPDPVHGLREAARTVRPGGRVVLAYGGRFASEEWDFWFEVLAKHAHRGTREPTLPAPTPIPDAKVAFEAAGLADTREVEAEIELPITDASAFVRGEQSHGARSFFDRFDPDVRREVEEELLAHLEARRPLVLHRASWFVSGRVPAAR